MPEHFGHFISFLEEMPQSEDFRERIHSVCNDATFSENSICLPSDLRVCDVIEAIQGYTPNKFTINLDNLEDTLISIVNQSE